MSTVAAASDLAQLKSAREDIKELLKSKFCHPILVFSFVTMCIGMLLNSTFFLLVFVE